MSLLSDNSRLRRLVEYHYRRNRHLTSACDAEDLFQESWIRLNHSDLATSVPQAKPTAGGHGQATECCEFRNDQEQNDQEQTEAEALRRAVRAAADRAFGRLRKRIHRGATSDRTLDFDPADRIPDTHLIMDLKQLIETLPLDERLVIEMLRSGYAGTEIAEELQVSPQAVTRRKQKAIERLRQGLLDS